MGKLIVKRPRTDRRLLKENLELDKPEKSRSQSLLNQDLQMRRNDPEQSHRIPKNPDLLQRSVQIVKLEVAENADCELEIAAEVEQRSEDIVLHDHDRNHDHVHGRDYWEDGSLCEKVEERGRTTVLEKGTELEL